MLLNFVSVYRVIQEEREVGIKIKERSAQKTIHLKNVAVGMLSAIVNPERSEPNPSAIERIDITKTVQSAIVNQVERNLSRGVKVVRAGIQSETERLLRVQMRRVIAGSVVPSVTSGIHERSVAM